MADLLIVGSVAYDDVRTPFGSVRGALGGSAAYASLAASLFSPVRLVGVVGRDFKAEDYRRLRRARVDMEGLERRPGRTFRWKGVYRGDMNVAVTLKTELNVFGNFRPRIPERARCCPFVFLANIHPVLQSSVLDQVGKPKFTALDTMNLWIRTARSALGKVLRRVDLVVLNDQEIRQLTKEVSLSAAARAARRLGPRYVVVKKGEHGAFLLDSGGFFQAPAVPLDRVVDPTGAGDSFAGGFLGYLARHGQVDKDRLREGLVAGNLVASFTVQDFGVRALEKLNLLRFARRARAYRKAARIPDLTL